MTKVEIKNCFVKTFIRKDKRERSLWLLQHKKKRVEFINRFNHRWTEMIAEKDLTELNIKIELNTFEFLKNKLNFYQSDLCYVISHNNDDGDLVDFKTAFENCQASGFATLIISENGKKFYLKTEQEMGAPKTFIGIK